MKHVRSRKVAYLGLLTALAALMGYIESMLPVSVGIPGVKLGLCNIVIVIVLYLYTWREALLVSIARILIVGFMFGNLFGMIYSAVGTILALTCMALLKRSGRFSIFGVSASGGAAHNIGQLTAACIMVQDIPFLGYAPVLILAGCAAGAAVGFLAIRVINRINR